MKMSHGDNSLMVSYLYNLRDTISLQFDSLLKPINTKFQTICHNMRGDRKSFKPQPEELKLGSSENLPTFEDALKHGQFLKETKYLKQNAKWKHIPIDVAEKLHQIWIQDFGIPENCLRPTSSTGKAYSDQFNRCSTYGNLNQDLEKRKRWVAQIGTIIDPYKCRCKIESNSSQTEYYQPDCKCQKLH